ncbi:MAG: bifunctional phosphoribosyl-AMP cyclohydrolase/phosphoribosyl-ATP diphosphatase HisIE [Eubacterium sp.]|nr:bifunctional phosphoribosyl-AMP cyclohydrolase/phosphoribosyl-ATP diphosphatase HisIE [Eubacterium sp.]
MDNIKIIPRIHADRISEDAAWYDNCGADELYYYDARSFEEGQEEDVAAIKAIVRTADIPVNVMARVRRFEDVKKMIYAGARHVIIDTDGYDNLDAVKEASDRFGADRIYLYLTETDPEQALIRARQAVEEEGFGGIVLWGDPAENDYVRTADFLKTKVKVPVIVMASTSDEAVIADILKMTMSEGIILSVDNPLDCMELKQALKKDQLPVNTFESAISFDDFKLNSDGMSPCITQDYKTGEVLMLAYMTRESFEKTIASGKMCYYSRSRQELWTKGDTSGHYQYVKALSIDCDNDTILAKVAQIGAACHTGNRSCFYRDLVRKEYDDRNPLLVFEEVFNTILDRKDHPREGSYTNYLFDKGVDKILKKVGEEATEIVIAAKNPDSDELKYEICDFLYHMMVLMAEQDVTWKEITDELATRH